MLRLCYRSLLWIGLLTSSSFLYAKKPSAEEEMAKLFLKIGVKMDVKLSEEDYKKIEAEKLYRKKLLLATLLLKGIEILCWLPMYFTLYQTYKSGHGTNFYRRLNNVADTLWFSKQGLYIFLYCLIPFLMRQLLHFYFPFPYYLKKGMKVYKLHIRLYQGIPILGEMISLAIAFFGILIFVMFGYWFSPTDIVSAIGYGCNAAFVLPPCLAVWIAFLAYPFIYSLWFLNSKKNLLFFKQAKKTYEELDQQRNALKAKCPDAERLLKIHDKAQRFKKPAKIAW